MLQSQNMVSGLPDNDLQAPQRASCSRGGSLSEVPECIWGFSPYHHSSRRVTFSSRVLVLMQWYIFRTTNLGLLRLDPQWFLRARFMVNRISHVGSDMPDQSAA